MEKILVEDLVKFKMIPFDIYSEDGQKLVAAGELLTSGKLLHLNQFNVLYKNIPDAIDEPNISKENDLKQEIQIPNPEETKAFLEQLNQNISQQEEELSQTYAKQEKPKEIIFDKTVNRSSKFKAQSQVDMKSYYATMMFSIQEDIGEESLVMMNEIKDKVINDVQNVLEEVRFCSELKLLGNYDDCHALNTAILATAMGYKLDYSREKIEKLTTAALLHDIGLTKIPKDILDKPNLSQKEILIYQKHPIIGYKILKEKMGVSEEICRVALEHHENNDGTGYPYKLSGEQISPLTRVISVCSFFDDLTSNKTKIKIKNTKEALRIILEIGTSRFFAEYLYKFVNMFNYNDIKNYDDMV